MIAFELSLEQSKWSHLIAHELVIVGGWFNGTWVLIWSSIHQSTPSTNNSRNFHDCRPPMALYTPPRAKACMLIDCSVNHIVLPLISIITGSAWPSESCHRVRKPIYTDFFESPSPKHNAPPLPWHQGMMIYCSLAMLRLEDMMMTIVAKQYAG